MYEETQTTLARSNEVAEEVISTMRTVRSFANEVGESFRYDKKLEDVVKIGMKRSLALTGYYWITEVRTCITKTGSFRRYCKCPLL